MNNTEIERKFLVIGDTYKNQSIKNYEIIQGYLCKDKDRTIRVRICGSRAFLTIKSSDTKPLQTQAVGAELGLARFEWERELTVEDAQQLLQLCLPGVIEKTRYIIPASSDEVHPDQPLFWEVDQFHGRLEGLTLAEIELQREEQTFYKADFIGEEVTGDPRYYNANM